MKLAHSVRSRSSCSFAKSIRASSDLQRESDSQATGLGPFPAKPDPLDAHPRQMVAMTNGGRAGRPGPVACALGKGVIDARDRGNCVAGARDAGRRG